MIRYDEKFSPTGQRISVVYHGKFIGKHISKKKNTFKYTSEGELAAKISYVWDNRNNIWIFYKRTNYTYSKDGNLKNVTFLKWNNKRGKWEMESSHKTENI